MRVMPWTAGIGVAGWRLGLEAAVVIQVRCEAGVAEAAERIRYKSVPAMVTVSRGLGGAGACYFWMVSIAQGSYKPQIPRPCPWLFQLGSRMGNLYFHRGFHICPYLGATYVSFLVKFPPTPFLCPASCPTKVTSLGFWSPLYSSPLDPHL